MAFYRMLGWQVESTGPHASVTFDNGFSVDLDQQEFAEQWNSGAPELSPGSVVLCLSVESRGAVDALWTLLVGAGYAARQRPYDAFWGSRFAIVDDPDAYQIGLMSPSEQQHRFWPPSDAPR